METIKEKGPFVAAGITTVVLQLLFVLLADTAEIKVLSAVGMRQVMLELEPRFERATGHTLEIIFDASGVIVKRIGSGEAADLTMITREALESLTKTGKVLAGSEVDLASSIAAVAVRQGAPKPEIYSAEAFRHALLDAKSIARPDPTLGGASGVHIAKVLERLGIADEINAKSIFASRPGDSQGMPGNMVADGRAEIALHQLQELLPVPGIEIVGPFPNDLQERFIFSAGVVVGATQLDAAKALINFLRTPDAIAVIKAKGMNPVP